MSEWMTFLAMIVMWLAGFMTCGAWFAPGPFWDGVRSIYVWGGRHDS